jgi:hypothetical protein
VAGLESDGREPSLLRACDVDGYVRPGWTPTVTSNAQNPEGPQASHDTVRSSVYFLLDVWPLLSSSESWGSTWYKVYGSPAVLPLEGTGRIQIIGS